jgi:hypothetical protein
MIPIRDTPPPYKIKGTREAVDPFLLSRVHPKITGEQICRID